MAWEGLALPRISTGRSGAGSTECETKSLNQISRNAARDEGSADGQSWARIGIKNSRGDHDTDSADCEKHANGLWAPERQRELPGGPEFESLHSGRDRLR
jgi:hypothetical protein